MASIERDDIHIVSRHSNWAENDVQNALQTHVYSDKTAWQTFLRWLFISLGVGFTVLGILFFFAYNWADLHKFVKLGLTQGLIIATVLVVLFSNLNETIKNILLTGASMLVGVLFAVYGQIYQTGANAYDFMLGWTLFVTIWVVVARFAPLWLLWMALVNGTYFFYTEQVANHWSNNFTALIWFVFNAIFLIITLLLPFINKAYKVPNWLINLLSLFVVGIATTSISFGIHKESDLQFGLIVTLSVLLYAFCVWYGLKTKNSYFLAIIPFSIIIIITSWLFRFWDSEGMFLFLTLFIIVSVTLTIKYLLTLHKSWNHEN